MHGGANTSCEAAPTTDDAWAAARHTRARWGAAGRAAALCPGCRSCCRPACGALRLFVELLAVTADAIAPKCALKREIRAPLRCLSAGRAIGRNSESEMQNKARQHRSLPTASTRQCAAAVPPPSAPQCGAARAVTAVIHGCFTSSPAALHAHAANKIPRTTQRLRHTPNLGRAAQSRPTARPPRWRRPGRQPRSQDTPSCLRLRVGRSSRGS